jgi:hypothetical protein
VLFGQDRTDQADQGVAVGEDADDVGAPGQRARNSMPRLPRTLATGPPDSYPDRTYTGKRRRAYESAVNHLHDQPPTLLDALANRDG